MLILMITVFAIASKVFLWEFCEKWQKKAFAEETTIRKSVSKGIIYSVRKKDHIIWIITKYHQVIELTGEVVG